MLQTFFRLHQFTRNHQSFRSLEILTLIRISSGSSTCNGVFSVATGPGPTLSLEPFVNDSLYKAGTAPGAVASRGRCPISHITSNPSSSSFWLPSTSCWRVGLRLPVMEMVQVMCSFYI